MSVTNRHSKIAGRGSRDCLPRSRRLSSLLCRRDGVCANQAEGHSAQRSPRNVLFVGNSYFYQQQPAQSRAQSLRSADPANAYTATSATISGAPLSRARSVDALPFIAQAQRV